MLAMDVETDFVQTLFTGAPRHGTLRRDGNT